MSSDGPTTAAEPTLIKSLRRGLELINVVADQGPLTAKELSSATGFPLPSTYHLLRTLVQEGYLCRDRNGRYVAGAQLRSAAEQERGARLVPQLRTELRSLSSLTGGSACLAVLDECRVVVVDFVRAPRAPGVDWWPGAELPLHATAIGRTILEQLGAEERERLLVAHGLARFTANTIIDPSRLLAALDGRAVHTADQEHTYGVQCHAAAVKGAAVPASIGVVSSDKTPAHRRARIAERLVEHAERVSVIIRDDAATSLLLANVSDLAG